VPETSYKSTHGISDPEYRLGKFHCKVNMDCRFLSPGYPHQRVIAGSQFPEMIAADFFIFFLFPSGYFAMQ
jgi:hypothetical protein